MKVPEYLRSTKQCRFDDLRPEFIAPIRKFIEENELGDVERNIINCYQTTSDTKSLFGTVLHQFTDMVITPEFLFWGVSGDKVKATQGCARLKDIAEIIDYEKSPLMQLHEDHGVQLSGFLYHCMDSSHRVTWFMGLGDDDAGKDFRAGLRNAVKAACK